MVPSPIPSVIELVLADSAISLMLLWHKDASTLNISQAIERSFDYTHCLPESGVKTMAGVTAF